jgi:hypothetical protein
VLLGLNGPRVSEACDTNIEDMGMERGYRVIYMVGKAPKPALIPLVPRTSSTKGLPTPPSDNRRAGARGVGRLAA